MLLIKYLSNTKASVLNTGTLFAAGDRQGAGLPTGGRGRRASPRLRPGAAAAHLYRLIVGLWYMHMYASHSSLRAQPWILLESKECRSSGDIFKYSPTSGQGVT